MEITYHKEGDYMIPDLTIEKEPKVILTKYGRDRLVFVCHHEVYVLLLFLLLSSYLDVLIHIQPWIPPSYNYFINIASPKLKNFDFVVYLFEKW